MARASSLLRTFTLGVKLKEIAAPATPGSGVGHVFAKSDGAVYYKNSAGLVVPLTAGVELDYAEITSSISTTSATMVNATGLSVTIPTGVPNAMMLHAEFPQVYNNTVANGLSISITDNSGNEQVRGRHYSSTANFGGHISLWKRLAAGSTGTYKIMYQREIGGTANISAITPPSGGAGLPFLRIVTV